jgi:hypothetical protein
MIIKCKICKSLGRINEGTNIFSNDVACPVCKGAGELEFQGDINDYLKCKSCNGSGCFSTNILFGQVEICTNCKGIGLVARPIIGNENVKEDLSPSSINDKIERMKTIMMAVATRVKDINEVNDEYKKLYLETDKYYLSKRLKNPNPYTDLWLFYQYWKDNLSTYQSRRNYVINLYVIDKDEKSTLKNQTFVYISLDRIQQLSSIENSSYDFCRLVKYCEEINVAFSNKNYFSIAMLLRAIIDHIPPIFSCKNFSEIANNYKGSKSFKESMKHLEESSRKIADSFLHVQIRDKEVLPTQNQIDFSNDLDVLLSEIIRIMKT